MIFAEITKRNYMSVSVTLKSYFYEVLIPSSQKNTSSPIEDILHHVSISFMKKLALYKSFNPRTHTGCDADTKCLMTLLSSFNPRTHTGCDLDREVLLLVLTSFNPRTHTGCDSKEILISESDIAVSIHAPTRGATYLIVRYSPTS